MVYKKRRIKEKTDMREYKVQQFASVSETVTARNGGSTPY